MNTNKIFSSIREGKRLTNEEFLYLYNEADLLELGRLATEVRERRFPQRMVTFIIDRNINYTNICSCACKFCAFYRNKNADDAYVINQEVLGAKIEEAIAAGATQLMIQGGLNPALKIDFFEDMFRFIKKNYVITLHSLTAPEIDFIARISGISTQETLLRLQAAGLDSLPGGGAEILDDEIRSQISPRKISTQGWLDIMRQAHNIGMETTATMMMGSIETLQHRLAHLERIRELQDETGGFRAFIAWTYQAGNNKLSAQNLSAVEYLKFLALSRLYLDNFAHIQGSWVTQGKRIGQMSLFFGADDLGSIMLEENVVKAAGTSHEMRLADMVELIKSSGHIPAQRDSEYNYIKLYNS